MNLLESARDAEINRTTRALGSGGGVVLLHGPEAQEAIDLTMLALARLPSDDAVAVVDVTHCADDEALSQAVAFSVASTYVGAIDEGFLNGEWRLQRDAELLTMVELASPQFYEALTRPRDSLAAPRELFELSIDAFTRRAADGPSVLAFLGADELVGSSSRRPRFELVQDGLWMLRGRFQQAIGNPYALFAGGERAAELIASDDAAFFGWGTEIALERLSFDLLRRQLEAVLGESRKQLGIQANAEVQQLAITLAGECAGSALLAQQLLDVLPAALFERSTQMSQTGSLAGRTVNILLRTNAERLRAQARLVRGAASNALKVAAALARDERPYSVVGHPSEASRALAALADAGIAHRRPDGRWELNDPLFALWLRQPQAGRLRTKDRSAQPVPPWALRA